MEDLGQFNNGTTYVNIILGFLGVGHERLNEELAKDALCVLDLLRLTGALSNPGLGLSPGLVESKETALATALDQLIGLGDEAGALLEEPRVGDLSLVENTVHIGILSEVEGSKSGRRVVLGRVW